MDQLEEKMDADQLEERQYYVLLPLSDNLQIGSDGQAIKWLNGQPIEWFHEEDLMKCSVIEADAKDMIPKGITHAMVLKWKRDGYFQ